MKRERLLHGDPATFAGQIHIDLIIGSPALDVDGITRDGEHVPLLRRGAWQL